MTLMKKSAAEFIGTFWLVLGGCGSAVLAAGYPELGIGFAGVALAFGLTVLTMAYAIGHISGCHLNPAVSVGLAVAGRFKFAELPAYVIFHDKTLKEMALERPTTRGALLGITGVGEKKADRYGDRFIDAIMEWETRAS